LPLPPHRPHHSAAPSSPHPPPTTQIYTLSLTTLFRSFRKYPDFQKEVDYAPTISFPDLEILPDQRKVYCGEQEIFLTTKEFNLRSEEHTSELQSRFDLVCRLLLEKQKEKCYHRHRVSD